MKKQRIIDIDHVGELEETLLSINNDLDLTFEQCAFLGTAQGDEVIFGLGKNLPKVDPYDYYAFHQWNLFGDLYRSYVPETIIRIKTNVPSGENYFESSRSCDYHFEKTENLDHLYASDFENALEKIKSQQFSKVVLKSRQYYKKEQNFWISELIHGLFDAYLEAKKSKKLFHLYGFCGPHHNYMGGTPETLLTKSEDLYETMALAGTSKSAEQLTQDKKELLEHELVVSDIKEKLNESDLSIGELRPISFSRFFHLFTPISFKSQLPAKDLVEKLTPTAALGGLPKTKALEFLKSTLYHEYVSESMYGGVLGLSFKNTFSSVVAIRNIQWDKKSLWIDSGTGIVKDSVLSKELKEVHLKRASVEEMFQACKR